MQKDYQLNYFKGLATLVLLTWMAFGNQALASSATPQACTKDMTDLLATARFAGRIQIAHYPLLRTIELDPKSEATIVYLIARAEKRGVSPVEINKVLERSYGVCHK